LADVRMVFNDQDRLPTEDLLQSLHGLDESPWGDWFRGRPLSARQLAKMLKPFGVSPVRLRVGERTLRGYLREDLGDAFARYLPLDALLSATSATDQPERG